MNIPKRVNVILGNNRKNYYTSIISDKHYLYSFENRQLARKCTEFLGEYKHRYDKFPPIDSDSYTTPELIEFYKRTPIEDIIRAELSIGVENTNNLISTCQSLNLDLLIISSFNYKLNINKIDLDFSAINVQTSSNAEYYDKFNITYLESLL